MLAVALRCMLTVLLCELVSGSDDDDVLLPACQTAARRPRTSFQCAQPLGASIGPALGAAPTVEPGDHVAECTSKEMCAELVKAVPGAVCPTSTTVEVKLFDGANQRPLGVTYPTGCAVPEGGFPFVVYLGFGSLEEVEALNATTVGFIKSKLLSQGIAFLQTTQYADDTYDARHCNSFELRSTVLSNLSACNSCQNDTTRLPGGVAICEPLKRWFICGNQEDGGWDRAMLRDLFARAQLNATPLANLNPRAMAYMGTSVAAHMASRAIEYGAALGFPFPTPRAAVMVSGASYACYRCPERGTSENLQPADEFVRCQWYSQGSVANSGFNKPASSAGLCGEAFPPFNVLPQNKLGVCPGHTLFPDATRWWLPNSSAQAADDPLFTEASWDTCAKPFAEHPPVLLLQPTEDSDAYWNAGKLYYEVLAHQKAARGCHMYAGTKMHGNSPIGNLANFNFLRYHLLQPATPGEGSGDLEGSEVPPDSAPLWL